MSHKYIYSSLLCIREGCTPAVSRAKSGGSKKAVEHLKLADIFLRKKLPSMTVDVASLKREQAAGSASQCAKNSAAGSVSVPTLFQALQILIKALDDLRLFNRAFNVTGSPALSICNGFSQKGLPLALQIGGRPFEDALVLRVGNALERALDTRTRRPSVH